jgi:hypothetical protein
MGLYRRKSTVVQAVQWFPGREVGGVRPGLEGEYGPHVVGARDRRTFLSPGDWVIYDHGEPGAPDGPLVLTDGAFRAIFEPA